MEDRDAAEEPPAEEPPAGPAGPEARGDPLFELSGSLQVGDVSIIHPDTSALRHAGANTDGAAVAHRDEQKRR
jgi:hypothetical protein